MLVPVVAISALLLLSPVQSGEGPPDDKSSSAPPPPPPPSPEETPPPTPTNDNAPSPETPQDGEGPDKDKAGGKKKLASTLLTAAMDYTKGKKPPPLKAQPLDDKDPKEAAGLLATEVLGVASDQAKLAIEKNKDAIIVPDNFKDHSNIEILKIFASLYYERRKLKFYMMLHAASSFLIGILTYFLSSNKIFLYVASFIDDHNEGWGANIEALWINHQEKMADFLLRLMEKKNIDPKSMVGKKMKVEYEHKKFAIVPVFRTYPDEPLPDDAKQINNNKVNLWKNMLN